MERALLQRVLPMVACSPIGSAWSSLIRSLQLRPFPVTSLAIAVCLFLCRTNPFPSFIFTELPMRPFLIQKQKRPPATGSVSYTHLRAHETPEHLVCRL